MSKSVINPSGNLPIEEIIRAKKNNRIIFRADPQGPKTEFKSKISSFFNKAQEAKRIKYEGELISPEDQIFLSLNQSQGKVGNCWLHANIDSILSKKYGIEAFAGMMRDLSELSPEFKNIRMVEKAPEKEAVNKGEFVIDTRTNQVFWLDKNNELAHWQPSAEELKEALESKSIQQLANICRKSNNIPTLGDFLGLPSEGILVRMKNKKDFYPEYLLLEKSIFDSPSRAQAPFYIQILEKAFASHLDGRWENLSPRKNVDANSRHAFDTLFFNQIFSGSFGEIPPSESNHSIFMDYDLDIEFDAKYIDIQLNKFLGEIKEIINGEDTISHDIKAMMNNDDELYKKFIDFLNQHSDVVKSVLAEKCHAMDKVNKLFESLISKYNEHPSKNHRDLIEHLVAIQPKLYNKPQEFFKVQELLQRFHQCQESQFPIVFAAKDKSHNRSGINGLNGEYISNEGFIFNHAFSVEKLMTDSFSDWSEGLYNKIYSVNWNSAEIKSKATEFFKEHGDDKVLVIISDNKLFFMTSSSKEIEITINPDAKKLLAKFKSLQPVALKSISEIPVLVKKEMVDGILKELPPKDQKDQKPSSPLTVPVLTIRNPWGIRDLLESDEQPKNPKGSKLIRLGNELLSIPNYEHALTTMTVEQAFQIGRKLTIAQISINNKTSEQQSQIAMNLLNNLEMAKEAMASPSLT